MIGEFRGGVKIGCGWIAEFRLLDAGDFVQDVLGIVNPMRPHGGRIGHESTTDGAGNHTL